MTVQLRDSLTDLVPMPLSARPPIQGESAAGFELAELLSSRVYLGIGVPRGNGRTVLVLPGFMGNDEYLRLLRDWLRRIGYDAMASGVAFNFGTPSALLNGVIRRVEYVSSRSPGRLIIVGHSLGGVFARAIAVLRPDLVAHVITLGSPIRGDPRAAAHPLVARLGELLLTEPGGDAANDALEGATLDVALPEGVQLTSIYTRTDGIVDWRSCIDADARAGGIEVHGTHCGLAWNREVYKALGPVLASSHS